MKKHIKLPKFKSEDQEREYWSKINLSEYFDPEDAVKVDFPNLKPSTKTISLRMPESLLDRIKAEANKRDVPYQSYIKIKLDEIFGHPARK